MNAPLYDLINWMTFISAWTPQSKPLFCCVDWAMKNGMYFLYIDESWMDSAPSHSQTVFLIASYAATFSYASESTMNRLDHRIG